ncbi:MAG: YafY family transcriptional regulator [Actinobacteria bacterium]|nr:YafY family transcriptional regulator [Actinomycetota bacterium]
MRETSARLLTLLSLLQARRDWSGADLAARLAVSERTVRRDIERLRDLGYPVHASRGTDGGYRLGAGAAMPPLLLDDDEAVAVAVGLRTAARSPVTGIEETSVRALAKLEQVLPSRLRRRVSALAEYTVAIPPDSPAPELDPVVLTTLASACRDHERLRLRYRSHDGTSTLRSAEPHRLVCWGRKWYLVAWDTGRDDWRTFRVDRIELRTPAGPRFVPRELPGDGDLAAYVARGVSAAGFRFRARVTVHAPAAEVAARISPAVGLVEAVDEHSCVLATGAGRVETVAVYLGLLDLDFTVIEPPELAERLRLLAARYQRAAGL